MEEEMEYITIPQSSKMRIGTSHSGKYFDPIGTVIHSNGDPGATLRDVYVWLWKYSTDASAHVFVHRNRAVCFIPLNEIAYHSGRTGISLYDQAWYRFHGVEMIEEEDGSIHPMTFTTAICTVVELCIMFDYDNVFRHYDMTGKSCPKAFVDNPSKWEDFQRLVFTLRDIRITSSKYSLSKEIEMLEAGNPRS
jgi:N-acetylmuramoyl-L-alanine amidase CwlA